MRRQIPLGRVRLVRLYLGEPTGSQPLWERPGIERTAFDFLRVFDRSWLERLEDLLKRPDPPDIHRGRVLRYDGAPDRFRRWLPVRVRAIRQRELAALGLADEDAVQ